MRLFHFSDDPNIASFKPRPVAVPSRRPPGRDWLNGPLVWGVDERHQPMYLFPRDCPRILLWPRADTAADDLDKWLGGRTCRMIAHIEWAWLDRLRQTTLYRYELPEDTFEDLDDAGMWVSRQEVTPLRMDAVADLPAALRADGVELRIMESLAPLRDVWSTSLHASGIRLRNAKDWPARP
ncbi:MAG: hypothetical protein P4L73_18220 [Caulobacteraceae bacterium]|nr:hypothetical protein [Caulobacteraceae bacterium]